MIKGNKDLLAPGSKIEVEVTDLNGRPIYHENAMYIEPGTKRRAVAIYVYEHTPQGGWSHNYSRHSSKKTKWKVCVPRATKNS